MTPGSSTSSFKPAPPPPPAPVTGVKTLIPSVHTAVTNWKTTVSAMLEALIATGVYFSAVPVAQLQAVGVTQKEIFYATIITGLARVYLALISKDAK